MAILNKIGIYLSILLCQLSTHTCAYGAASIPPPNDLGLQLPNGFSVSIFANVKEHGLPRMMQFDTQGHLYVALANSDKVLMLADTNQDGKADLTKVVADNLDTPNSVALIDDQTMLIANQNGVVKLIKQVEQWSKPANFISNLPTGGHTLKTIKLGPDGFLYINVGSSCNVCVENNPLRATILRFDQSGKAAGHLTTVGRHAPSPVWAEGLRNSQGFAWHPATGDFYATNEGADNRSETKNGKVNDALPPEHLNIIKPAHHFGWPYCWQDTHNPTHMFQDPNFLGADNFCKSTTAPAISFASHSTPIGMTFLNNSNFPTEYQSDAIVALHGSWNRKMPSGYQLVRVKFKDNKPYEVVEFVTGWLSQDGAWGRPVDVTINPNNGALYVSDDSTGNIYRISYSISK